MKRPTRWLGAVILTLALSAGGLSNVAWAQPAAKKTATKKQHKVIASKAKRSHMVRTAMQRDNSPVVPQALKVASSAALVLDQATGAVLFEKNAHAVLPIASITKLMTAMVALDAQPDLHEILSIDDADVDLLKGTHSRLTVGTQLSRENMLRLALMSSENRAASTLSRHYPGGRAAFVAAMNHKAHVLGLDDTSFEDATGLTPRNVSSARDLVKLVAAAQQYPLIREFSTTTNYDVVVRGRELAFHNTNSLVRSGSWDIGVSKTGYINEAGRCLVMQAWLGNRPTVIVLLDSLGKMSRIGDANRIKQWVERQSARTAHNLTHDTLAAG